MDVRPLAYVKGRMRARVRQREHGQGRLVTFRVLLTLTPTIDLDLNLDVDFDLDLDIDLDLEPQKITLGLMLTSRCGSRFRCRFRFGKLKTCWQDHNNAGIHLHSTHCRFQEDTQVE